MCFNLLIEILDFQEHKELLNDQERRQLREQLKHENARQLKELDHRFYAKLGLYDE